MKIQIFSAPVCKRYFSSRLSLAYILALIATALVITVPYILSNDITPLRIHHEQPRVEFVSKVIVVLQSDSKELFFSTIGELNDLRPESFSDASISVFEEDRNRDGLNDRIKLNMEFPIEAEEQIVGLQAFIFASYHLQNAQVSMESLIFVHHNGVLPGSAYTARGDLILRQNMPMQMREHITELYPSNGIINDFKAAINSMDSNIDTLLDRYENREMAPFFLQRAPLWHRDPSGKKSNQSFESTFNLKVIIDIPKLQEVVYISTFSQVLLDVWMRYLSLLVIAVYLMRRLFTFMFTNQIISSHTRTDWQWMIIMNKKAIVEPCTDYINFAWVIGKETKIGIFVSVAVPSKCLITIHYWTGCTGI